MVKLFYRRCNVLLDVLLYRTYIQDVTIGSVVVDLTF